MSEEERQPVLAILVGGRSSRMGVRAKGRLLSPLSLTPIVEHLVIEGDKASLETIFVGAAEDYVDLAPETHRIADSPCAEGPLAGVIAAAEYAAGRTLILVGCDMPYVDAHALLHLLNVEPTAVALAPKRDGKWEPFFSRWQGGALSDVAHRLTKEDTRGSLQRLFSEVGATPLQLDGALQRALHDWDAPSDRDG